MQIPIDKVIEEMRQGRYYFDGQCEWSKHEEDNHAPVCHHFDCIKSFYINHTLKLKENKFAEIASLEEQIANFMQAGEIVACGSCFPNKFPDCRQLRKDFNYKCECKCHRNALEDYRKLNNK